MFYDIDTECVRLIIVLNQQLKLGRVTRFGFKMPQPGKISPYSPNMRHACFSSPLPNLRMATIR